MQTQMTTELQKSFGYFVAHQRELVEQYAGKFIVIHNEKVVGVYDSVLEATMEAQKKFPLGEFLVQKVQAGTDSFTHTYYSRVAA